MLKDAITYNAWGPYSNWIVTHYLPQRQTCPTLQQISAREMQLCLTHYYAHTVGGGAESTYNKKSSHTKVMDSEVWTNCYGSNFAKA